MSDFLDFASLMHLMPTPSLTPYRSSLLNINWNVSRVAQAYDGCSGIWQHLIQRQNISSEELLRHLAAHYNIHLLQKEIMVAKSFLARKDKVTITNTTSMRPFPPGWWYVPQGSLSSCSRKRSSSTLRRLLTWLWGTVGQEWLSHLAVMSIEKEWLAGVDHRELQCDASTFSVLREMSQTERGETWPGQGRMTYC